MTDREHDLGPEELPGDLSGAPDPRWLRVARFVDGELSTVERDAFARDLVGDAGLAAEVDALRELRTRVAASSSSPVVVDAERFRRRVMAAVVAAAAGGDTAVQDAAPASGQSDLAGADLGMLRSTVLLCRQALWAALALIALGVAALSGLLRVPDSGQVEASAPEMRRVMDQLDARTRARRSQEFGQPGFGQPGFGQPEFGQPGFGGVDAVHDPLPPGAERRPR